MNVTAEEYSVNKPCLAVSFLNPDLLTTGSFIIYKIILIPFLSTWKIMCNKIIRVMVNGQEIIQKSLNDNSLQFRPSKGRKTKQGNIFFV